MKHTLKKKLTYATIAFYFICCGIDYGIIFPTIWGYLKFLGAEDENLLGFSVAAISLSSMIMSPAIGKWYDETRDAKRILIVMNIFEIGGSVLYFMAPNPWFVVLSRFICGLGSCAGTAVMADITQTSSIQDRTAIMSNFQVCRQIGMFIGPGFNLLLREINFNLGQFPVNNLTSPGFFMATLGVVSQLLFLTTYFNLDKGEVHQKLVESLHYDYGSIDYEDQWSDHQRRLGSSLPSVNSEPECDGLDAECAVQCDGRDAECAVQCDGRDAECAVLAVTDTSVGDSCRYCRGRLELVLSQSGGSDSIMEDAEKYMGAAVCALPGCSHSLPRSDASLYTGRYGGDSSSVMAEYQHLSVCSNNTCINSFERENNVLENRVNLWECAEEFLRDELVVLLGINFIASFTQTVLETIVTILTLKFYNFGELENSLLFIVAGVEIMFALVSINFLSRRLQDRTLIFAGSVVMIFSLSWYLVFVPNFSYGDWNSLPHFIMGIFTNLLGISLLTACSISLFSKLISKERQGLGHGIRRAMLSAGMILGPLWGGSAIDMLVVLFSVPLALVVFFFVLFCFSFHKLKVQTDEDASERAPNFHSTLRSHVYDQEERTPLLSQIT